MPAREGSTWWGYRCNKYIQFLFTALALKLFLSHSILLPTDFFPLYLQGKPGASLGKTLSEISRCHIVTEAEELDCRDWGPTLKKGERYSNTKTVAHERV